jgi:hypothetical protein
MRVSMKWTGSPLNLPGGGSEASKDVSRNRSPGYQCRTAWWFPDNEVPGHGRDESTITILTDNAYESCDPAVGATHVRTLLCNMYPENKEALNE